METTTCQQRRCSNPAEWLVTTSGIYFRQELICGNHYIDLYEGRAFAGTVEPINPTPPTQTQDSQ